MMSILTDRAKKCFDLAKQRSQKDGRSSISSIDLILAILEEGNGSAITIINNLHYNYSRISANLQKHPNDILEESEIKLILLAEKIAQKNKRKWIGTEHILTGIMSDQTLLATQVITHMGISYESVRQQLHKLEGIPYEENTPDSNI